MAANIMDMITGMQQAAPAMNQLATNIGTALMQLVRLNAELVKQSSPASGYDVKQGTTTDKYEDNQFLFNLAPRSIDITVEGNDITIQLSYDGVAFEKEFFVKSGVVSSLAITCRAIRLRSRVAGSAGTYQAVVMA